ncbi:MAG: hypothetical protein HY744_20655 [Deltaproteobacteria bacterium]|nr:hypothetical protein [Deltaproteobacteria bacterium]
MQLARCPQEVRNTVAELEPTLGPVTVGQQPSTPTRLTMSTPSENTVLSLGAKKSAEIEAGLTGRTDNHAHTWVSAAGKQTLEVLGDPTKLDPHGADDPWPKAFRDKVRSDTAAAATGHGVYTTGAAYHYADGDCRFVSASGNALVRARGESAGWAALHADHGAALVMANDYVHIGSRKGVTIGTSAIIDMPAAGDKLHYSGSVADPTLSWTYVGAIDKTAGILATIGMGVFGLVSKIVQYWTFKFEPATELPAWIPKRDSKLTKVGVGLGLVGLATSIASGVVGAAASQSVNVVADNCVSLFGGHSASAWGLVTASLGSGLATTVSGLLTSLSGMLNASIDSGLNTSVGGATDVDIKALWGKATMRGGLRGVEISSPKAHLALAASKRVELKSTLDKVFVVGSTGALVAAGAVGPGFGVEVRPACVKIGMIPSVAPYGAAMVAKLPTSITVAPQGLALAFGAAVVEVNAMGHNVKGPMVMIKADGVTKVGGSMLMLGS